MKAVREVLIHRLDIAINEEGGTFSFLEDGTTVLGPIPLTEAPSLATIMGVLIGDMVRVLACGEVSHQEGLMGGGASLRVNEGTGRVEPVVYLGCRSVAGRTSTCYFTGNMYELLDLIQGVVK